MHHFRLLRTTLLPELRQVQGHHLGMAGGLVTVVGTQKRSCRLGWILPGPWGWQRSEVSKGQTQGCREEKPKCRAGRSTAWRQDGVGQPNSLWDREKISLRGQIWTLLSVCPSWSFWCSKSPTAELTSSPLQSSGCSWQPGESREEWVRGFSGLLPLSTSPHPRPQGCPRQPIWPCHFTRAPPDLWGGHIPIYV